jgi:hypothetical protein
MSGRQYLPTELHRLVDGTDPKHLARGMVDHYLNDNDMNNSVFTQIVKLTFVVSCDRPSGNRLGPAFDELRLRREDNFER